MPAVLTKADETLLPFGKAVGMVLEDAARRGGDAAQLRKYGMAAAMFGLFEGAAHGFLEWEASYNQIDAEVGMEMKQEFPNWDPLKSTPLSEDLGGTEIRGKHVARAQRMLPDILSAVGCAQEEIGEFSRGIPLLYQDSDQYAERVGHVSAWLQHDAGAIPPAIAACRAIGEAYAGLEAAEETAQGERANSEGYQLVARKIFGRKSTSQAWNRHQQRTNQLNRLDRGEVGETLTAALNNLGLPHSVVRRVMPELERSIDRVGKTYLG